MPAPDGRIAYRPKDALSDAERDVITRYREDVRELLERDPVRWRAAVMATQMTRTGSIPLLMARPGMRMPMGSCCSCGDPLDADQRYRCRPCVEAAVVTLAAASD